jgi:hypothetical protein
MFQVWLFSAIVIASKCGSDDRYHYVTLPDEKRWTFKITKDGKMMSLNDEKSPVAMSDKCVFKVERFSEYFEASNIDSSLVLNPSPKNSSNFAKYLGFKTISYSLENSYKIRIDGYRYRGVEILKDYCSEEEKLYFLRVGELNHFVESFSAGLSHSLYSIYNPASYYDGIKWHRNTYEAKLNGNGTLSVTSHEHRIKVELKECSASQSKKLEQLKHGILSLRKVLAHGKPLLFGHGSKSLFQRIAFWKSRLWFMNYNRVMTMEHSENLVGDTVQYRIRVLDGGKIRVVTNTDEYTVYIDNDQKIFVEYS